MLLHLVVLRLLPVEDAVAVKVVADAVKAVAVAVEATGEKTVKAVVAVVAVVNAVKVAAENAVTVVKVVVAVVSAVIAETVRAAEEAAPELKVAMAKPAWREAEVASPDKIGSTASLVKKPTQWTDKTALAVAAVVIVRTETAEADGVVLALSQNQPRTTRPRTPQKKRRRRQPDQSLSLLWKRKRRLAPLLMSTERNKPLAPRDFSVKSKKQEPERRFKRRL